MIAREGGAALGNDPRARAPKPHNHLARERNFQPGEQLDRRPSTNPRSGCSIRTTPAEAAATVSPGFEGTARARSLGGALGQPGAETLKPGVVLA